MINDSKRYFDHGEPLDYALMMTYINDMSERYPFISVTYLGESILGRGIPMITLGVGDKNVMYIGAHGGTEWGTSLFLLRFVSEYAELYSAKRSIFSYDLEYLFESRSICVVPMLNPDGVEYSINGVAEDNPLYERISKMNVEASDYSNWDANARGVMLSRNYNYGFTERKQYELERGISEGAFFGFSGNMPCSEPEVASLCNYLRFSGNISSVLSLCGAGVGIGYSKLLTGAERVAQTLVRACGYKLRKEAGEGFCDWCASALHIPAFELFCGDSQALASPSDRFKIYTDIRKLLFSMPFLL